MQNVMLQMGLRLLSVNGMAINTLRQFVLRCHACFK
jgi:RNA-binding protein NOB1